MSRNVTPVTTAAAIAVATALTLSACGSPSGAGGSSKSAASASGANLHLKTPGTLTAAFRSDDKPASFIQNGKPAGFDIDLMTAVATEMGLKVKFVSTDFDSMVPNVRNHIYDTAAFGVLVTPKRKEVVNFTTPTDYGQAQLVSNKNKPVANIEGAKGKTVAVTRGSALIPLLKKLAPGVTIREFPNVAASANALEAGQVDGLFTGQATTSDLLKKHPDFTATQKVISGTDAFPVAKDRAALNTAIDAALKKVMTDGTYTTLFDKWNPKSITIPQQLMSDYPGLKQRPGASSAG